MAQLKDLTVNGQSRFVGDVYANIVHGTLDSNGTASQLIAGDGTLQQIVSAITDSTTGVPNQKAVYDYVEANGLKKQSGELTITNHKSEFLYFSGAGTGILLFSKISTSDYDEHSASCYFISRSWNDLNIQIEVQKISGWIYSDDPSLPPSEWFIKHANIAETYGFINSSFNSGIPWKFYQLSGNINVALSSKTVDLTDDAHWTKIILPESSYTVATQSEIDALFAGGGSGSGSGSGSGGDGGSETVEVVLSGHTW